ncbi:uncharacterized protein ACRADG_010946 [Cochliomyia hominivorax]
MALTIILFYILIALATLALYIMKKRLNYWKDQGIAHSEPHFIAGNLNGLHTQRNIATCVKEVYDKFRGTGPFCGFYFFQRPAVLVLDMELVKNILIKDFNNFTDRGLYHNEKDDPLTGHLFLLDGNKWKNLRQKLSPTFTSGKMKLMYPTVTQVAKQLVEIIFKLKGSDQSIELKELLGRFTTDIIGRCAFGINCNSLEHPQAEFLLMGRRALKTKRHGKILMSFIQGFPDLTKKFHMKVMPDDITDFFVRIVKENVTYRESNNVKANDFLGILIDMKNSEGNEKSVKLSIEEMAAQTFVFFLAGFETSSATMAFALYELALNQKFQDRLRQEINEAFDDQNHISYEAVHSLQYLGQVISETLRKYTLVPHLNRQALKDYVVPGHPKYIIKKGMPILIPAYGIHHDPDIYPEPEIFDPERFNADNTKQRDSVEFLSFGDGPRNCIGMRFGLMQTRVGLAYLLHNFKFSVCDKTEIPLEFDRRSFILESKTGIFLKILQTSAQTHTNLTNYRGVEMALTTILLYLLIAVASLVVYFIKKRLNYWKDLDIPHPKPHFFAGNLKGVNTERNIAQCVREIYEQFKKTGPFCGFYFFQRPSVLVLDMGLAKNILIKDFTNFTDRGLFHNEKDDPLTGHLFLLDGNKWKNLRQKLSPTFTSGKMKFMYPTLTQVAEQFVEVFSQLTEQNHIIEIKELLARFTTDIIGSCAFGINCNSLKDPKAEFRLMGKRSLTERRHGNLIMGFIFGFPELAKKLHMKIVLDDVTQFFMRIVKETVAYREANNIQCNDFLSILIDLKNGKEGEKAVKLSVEEMAAQAFVFFLGGFETSSSTMGFTLYELAQHQEIQDKLRQEINEAFNGEKHINYETIHNLQYLGQVISETLRKYTIVPHLNRQALNDYVVPGHPKYIIKKDMSVLIPAYAMHHDPDLYPEPEKFDPDRFSSTNTKQRDGIEFLAFGDGPRNCIGMRFGIMQTRVGLAYLLHNFRFSVCDKTEIPLIWNNQSFLLASKNGIYLKVEKV